MNNIFISLAEKIGDLLLEKFNLLFNNINLVNSVEELTRELISEASYTLKEKIYLEDIKILSINDFDFFGYYIHHNGKLASFVILEGGDEGLAREISMQIVANDPKFLSKKHVSDEIINSKIDEISKDLANEASGKSPEIIEKMINGRINK
jgi:elongation factor Ts